MTFRNSLRISEKNPLLVLISSIKGEMTSGSILRKAYLGLLIVVSKMRCMCCFINGLISELPKKLAT